MEFSEATGLADVDLAAAFVRHRHAVSWIARDDTSRLHGARPYAGGHGSAVDCGPRRTCFPAFHHDATLADEASPAAWRARGLDSPFETNPNPSEQDDARCRELGVTGE